MTVQIAAASTALILGHEKRKNGRWKRGSMEDMPESGHTKFRNRLQEAGLVLDILGPAHLRGLVHNLNTKAQVNIRV